MPDWEAYTITQVQQQYEEYVRERERQKRIMEQMLREEEERIEEMWKYPLFFWRETCEPILDLRKKKII